MKLKNIGSHVRVANLSIAKAGAKSAFDYRGNSTQRGYGYRWQNARTRFLKKSPLCIECEKLDRVEPATEVDHIVPHRGDQELFWKESNWQSLCKSCHSKKTARGE